MSLRSRSVCAFALTLPALGVVGSAHAQFEPDPGVNTLVADPGGQQSLPLIGATSDAGFWLTWFSAEGGNLNLRAQRFTGGGKAVFPAPGLLISDEDQNSALFGYDMLVDDEDHLVVAFSDERLRSGLNVVATRIAPDGQPAWGPDGVQLSNNSDFEVDPRVVQVGDEFVVVWPSGPGLVMQTLDRSGATQLRAGAMTIVPGAPGFHEMVPTPDGHFIIGYQRRFAFPGPERFIDAQKFSTAGAAQWNSGNPVVVNDAAQLGVAQRIRLISDQQGGAFFAWHDDRVLNASNVFVQHLDTNGVAQMVDDGLAVSSLAGRQRFDPAISYDIENDLLNVAWDERDAIQSQRGLYAQAIDVSTCVLSFGPNGIELEGLSSNAISDIEAVQLTTSVLYMCHQDQGSVVSDRTIGFRVGPNGANLFPQVPLVLCSDSANKFRGEAALATTGLAAYAWQDERADDGGIYLQTVNPDGTLGPAPCPADWNEDGFLNDTDFFDWVNDFFSATGPQGQSDFNDDGFENAQDWFDFVNAFFDPFPGCLVVE